MLGNSDVGKTSLIGKYRSPDMQLGPKVTTYGTDVITVYLSINNESVIKVKLWDTAGQDKSATVSGNYARNLDACLLVFDLTKHISYESVSKWLHEL